MIRRVLLRVLLAGVLCSLLVVSSVGMACYLAVSPPSDYARLVTHHADGGDAAAAERRFEQVQDDLRQWQTRSLTLQHAQENARQRGADEPAVDYDPSKDLHTVRVGQDEINDLFASDDFRISGGQLTDPRVAMSDGRFQVGCLLATPAGPVVLTGGFEALPPRAGELRLRMVSARLGRLPLPLATVCSWLPKDNARMSGKLYLDTTGPTPELSLRLPEEQDRSPRVEGLSFVDGAIVVRLTPPVLERD